MDRNRPLWDITVVDGLRGGRTALIARVHHCLADGIAGVSLMNLILIKVPSQLPCRASVHSIRLRHPSREPICWTPC